MPQDSLRSIVYRSFVVCDDPKGVEESRIIRRSKSDSKNVDRKIEFESEEERASKVAMEEHHHHHSSSSGQLLEVSRGARKLNRVIDSWSRTNRCDDQDIANDLLKGALELQDSLHMLGKLQEASNFARVKKKEKAKNDQLIPRDCIEELREVIRDSFARQNLLPNINSEQKRSLSSRYHADSALDMPSTSSSRSSSFQTCNFTSMDSSVWSPAEEKKARGPSLIAKLMGLEEMPSKSLHTSSQNNDIEHKKIFSQQRPTFEIDTPKARKSRVVFGSEDREKSLKDVLETMHFKGLLKNNSIKDINPDPYQQRLMNNCAPIVLIKPRHIPRLRSHEKFAPVFQEEGSSNIETMLKKRIVKEDSPSSNDRGLKRGAKDSRGNETRPVHKEVKIKQNVPTKARSSGSMTQPLPKKVAAKKSIDIIPKPVTSSRKPVEKEVAKAKNLSRFKDQVKVSPRKSNKPENTSSVTKNKVSHQPSGTPNSNSVRRPQTILRGPIDAKKVPTKRAVSNKAIVAKITTERLECKGDKVVSEGKKIILTPKNDTVLEGNMIDPALESDTRPQGKRIDHASEYETVSEGYSTETADQLPIEEPIEHTDNQIEEYSGESSICDVDVTRVTIDDENSIKYIGEVDDDPITPIVTDGESFMTRTSLKELLLSSPVFINHAEEFFDLHVNVPTTSQNLSIGDISDVDTLLLLDCADEIVRRRSYPDSQMIRPPWLSLVGNAKRRIYLDRLVNETCDGVEALRSYNELAGENYPSGNFYAMLEKDIYHSEAVSGIWDLGWKKGFSVDDIIQAVEDIEKQVLRGLIAEICA